MVGNGEYPSFPGNEAVTSVLEAQVMERDAAQGLQGDGAHGDDQCRPNQVQGRGEPRCAGALLPRGGPAVSVGTVERQTEHGVGDEDGFPGHASFAKEQIEPAARRITGERGAGARRAEPPGRFADEHDARR